VLHLLKKMNERVVRLMFNDLTRPLVCPSSHPVCTITEKDTIRNLRWSPVAPHIVNRRADPGGDAVCSNVFSNSRLEEFGARHLSKARRDASYLRAGLEVGARHLSKDAAG
jgi:hypothetical protein